MPRLSDLTASPSLRGLLEYAVHPASDRPIMAVEAIEDIDGLGVAARDTIVVLTRGASQAASSYSFDVAMRLAGRSGVRAVVLTGDEDMRISPTAAAIAERNETALLVAAQDTGLTELVLTIARELAGEADVALVRAHAAMRALSRHPDSGRPEALVEVASRALGAPLEMGEAPSTESSSAPVIVDGEVETYISSRSAAGDMAMATELVLELTAAALGTALTASRRHDELPIQSRTEVLTELLTATAQEVPALVRRARQLGIPIDGWHVAARIEFENAQELADSEVAAYERRVELFRSILRLARASGGTWQMARSGSAMVVFRMYRDDPGSEAVRQVAARVEGCLRQAVESRAPGAALRCGVGDLHAGTSGPATSEGEARAAVAAARASNRVNRAVPFDSVGLRRTLVEWYASATAREAVRSVLAPLDELSSQKARQAIQTLQVYLDRQGSLSKTAESLNLHRNAVAYRINRIFSLLDVDRDSPDDLLLLQLACRAREMS